MSGKACHIRLACSPLPSASFLLSFTEDITLVISQLQLNHQAPTWPEIKVQAQMTYHFLQHLERSGFENVSYLRHQFNEYKDTVEEAAKLEPVRKIVPNIKYLG